LITQNALQERYLYKNNLYNSAVTTQIQETKDAAMTASLDNSIALNSNSINGPVLENIIKKDKLKYYLYVKCPNCKQDTTMVLHCEEFNDYKEHIFDLYTCMKCKDTFAYNDTEKWLAGHKETVVRVA